MFALIEKLEPFLRWWKQGLLHPWQWLRQEPLFVISAGDGVLNRIQIDAHGCAQSEPLDRSQLPALKRQLRRARVYLFIPTEQVMVSDVSAEQRPLHASDIAAEILPFAPHELVAVLNATQDHLYCVLQADVVRAARKAQSLLTEYAGDQVDGPLSGVAIATPARWLSAEVAIPPNSGNDQPISQSARTRSPILRLAGSGATFCLLGLIGLWAGALLAQRLALHEQHLLREQLVELTKQSPVPITHPLSSVLTYERARSAQETRTILDSLLISLGTADVLSQLIVTNDNLVVDASSDDASSLQLALREIEHFGDVEFVAGITTRMSDTQRESGPNERFRLKVTLATVHLPSAEAAGL